MVENQNRLVTQLEQRVPDAKTAAGYFIQASVRYPASETAQAAYIALLSQRTKCLPEMLGRSLLSDRDQIKHIEQTAHKAHSHAGIGPARLQRSILVRVVGEVFALADEMMILDEAELKSVVTDLFPNTKNRILKVQ